MLNQVEVNFRRVFDYAWGALYDREWFLITRDRIRARAPPAALRSGNETFYGVSLREVD